MSNTPASPHVAIIGAGPAGLIAAERLAAAGLSVTVYDRMPSVGRKFLMAGRGGLNLTHSEPIEPFLARYGGAAARLKPLIEAFPPAALIAWAEESGQQTFVGSSGRVFPKALKASPLLRALLNRLAEFGVTFRLRHEWLGWTTEGALRFAGPDGEIAVKPDAVLLALGGASWPRLGSTGSWISILRERGVPVRPLRPANAGFQVAWSESFRARFAGEPLKAIGVRFGERSVRGEATITHYGIEGGAIYALSSFLREAVERDGAAEISIDLRPAASADSIARRIARQKDSQSLANRLRKAIHLAPVSINLLRETSADLVPRDAAALAARIKAVPLRLGPMAGIERAISSAGGIAFDGLDDNLMLTALPGVFAAGEMLDWEAPTGGYLLQACFSTGIGAADGILRRLGQSGKAAETAFSAESPAIP